MAIELKDTNGNLVNLHTNFKPRPIVSFSELPLDAREWFDYVSEEEHFDSRFFNYLDSWFDLSDGFTAEVPDYLRAKGFDAVLPDSYFSATVVWYFDADGNYTPHEGEIIVGRINW